jgi:DNA-binding response OmpR family regulator
MRVLVVEDARRLADGIGEGLRDEGMAVDVSYDGIDALSKVAVNRYDVVVLDRDLPGAHGDVVCREIVEHEEGPMVLMLTAADEPFDRVAGLRVGADDYLTKPFEFDELVLRVRGLARRKPRASPRILRAAGVELDPLARVATRSGRRLDLSVNEFGVLV